MNFYFTFSSLAAAPRKCLIKHFFECHKGYGKKYGCRKMGLHCRDTRICGCKEHSTNSEVYYYYDDDDDDVDEQYTVRKNE